MKETESRGQRKPQKRYRGHARKCPEPQCEQSFKTDRDLGRHRFIRMTRTIHGIHCACWLINVGQITHGIDPVTIVQIASLQQASSYSIDVKMWCRSKNRLIAVESLSRRHWESTSPIRSRFEEGNELGHNLSVSLLTNLHKDHK